MWAKIKYLSQLGKGKKGKGADGTLFNGESLIIKNNCDGFLLSKSQLWRPGITTNMLFRLPTAWAGCPDGRAVLELGS